MYQVKMMFTLIQVGTNLWVNPMQVQGVAPNRSANAQPDCQVVILAATPSGALCSDWSIERVKEALAPATVAKAMETK